VDFKLGIRRSDSEPKQSGGVYDGIGRYYDHVHEVTVIKLLTGDCYVTDRSDEVLVTILGSCVSVCARDVEAKIGGMNHILLPGERKEGDNYRPAVGEYEMRFGVYAMEELFNGIYKLGGRKKNLEVKVFGGANVLGRGPMIGDKNIDFVREFLDKEGMKIKSIDVGGVEPRRLHYYPDEGRVMLRKLHRLGDMQVADVERDYAKDLLTHKDDSDIELFGDF